MDKKTWLDLCRKVEEATGPCPHLVAEITALIREMYPPRSIQCADPIDGGTWYVEIQGRPNPSDVDHDQWSWTGVKMVRGHYDDDTYQYGFSSADQAEAAARDWFRIADLGTLDVGTPVPDVPESPGWARLRIATPSRKHPHGREVIGRTWHVRRAIRDWMAAQGMQPPKPQEPAPEATESIQPLKPKQRAPEPVIYSLLPLDIGFDPRAHEMPVELPDPLDGLWLDIQGRRVLVRGTREELIAAARQAGYRIAE